LTSAFASSAALTSVRSHVRAPSWSLSAGDALPQPDKQIIPKATPIVKLARLLGDFRIYDPTLEFLAGPLALRDEQKRDLQIRLTHSGDFCIGSLSAIGLRPNPRRWRHGSLDVEIVDPGYTNSRRV
jgi:hypothetical protein